MNDAQRKALSRSMKQSWKARKALPVITRHEQSEQNISTQDKQHAVLLLQAVVKLLER